MIQSFNYGSPDSVLTEIDFMLIGKTMLNSETNTTRAVGFLCKHPGQCPICDGMFGVGDRIMMVDKTKVPRRDWMADHCKPKIWTHLQCAVDLRLDKEAMHIVCKHWLRDGTCLYGDRCQFLHPKEQAKAAPREERRTWGGRRKVIRNICRVTIFRKFLLEKYGLDLLNQGSGVLDVAGGQGELGFELIHLNGIRCTIMEPRDLKLKKFARKFSRGMYHRNVFYSQFVHRDMSEGLTMVNHLQLFLTDELIRRIDQKEIDQLYIDTCFETAIQTRWTPKGLLQQQHENDDIKHEHEEDEEDDDDTESAFSNMETDDVSLKYTKKIDKLDDVLQTLENFSFVAGMHPDQATEAIVDLALKFGKPFAVVPCCVYGKCFPKRALKDGTPVQTYEQLIQHLVEKDPAHIKTAKLDFEGRNIVVYYDIIEKMYCKW